MSDILAGAVAGLRLLADGTVRVSLDFEPKDRNAAMSLLGEPGAMIACARLRDGTDAKLEHADPRGPLCMEAIGLCNNPMFQRFIGHEKGSGYDRPPTPEGAKDFILAACGGLHSRKELDSNEEAARCFAGLRRSFQRWAAEQA